MACYQILESNNTHFAKCLLTTELDYHTEKCVMLLPSLKNKADG